MGRGSMGGGDGGDVARVLLFNPLGQNRTEMLTIAVPVCNMVVFDESGVGVPSQVTMLFGINDGQYPYL